MTQNQPQSRDNNIMEGLRKADLKDMIDPIFTVDHYQSKMGKDEDVIVLRFRAADKEPAIDLMEFIEKGYPFVLDADMSSGEERDGEYSVFVEIERTENAPDEIEELLNGISRLCDISSWRFRWYKDIQGHTFDKEVAASVIPLTSEEYKSRLEGSRVGEIVEFFNQGALDEIIVEGNNITFKKAFTSPLSVKLIALGEYNVLKCALEGPLQLDESSRGQVLFLNKYLGNYDINKIEGHFLIRNGQKAVILSKQSW